MLYKRERAMDYGGEEQRRCRERGEEGKVRVWVVLLARRDVGRGTVRGGEGKVTRISNLPIDKRDNEDSRRESVSERGS